MEGPTSQTLSIRVDDHDRRLEKHETVHHDLWDSINRIQNRPPVWASAVIAIMTGIVGVLAGLKF